MTEELKIEVMPAEFKPHDKRLDKMKYKDSLPKIPSNIVLLGRCGSGKSSALYTMLNKGYVTDKGKSIFDEMLIYLGTLDAVEAFKKLPCKNLCVLHEFDPIAFETYLNDLKQHQMERLAKGKPCLNVAIVFDDFVGQALQKKIGGKASPLERLMLTSRHECNATVFFCSQTYKNNGLMNPTVRNNVNYYMLFALARSDVMKVAEEHSGHILPEEFVDMYERVHSAPHRFMMIDYKVGDDKRFREGFSKPLTKKMIDINRDGKETS